MPNSEDQALLTLKPMGYFDLLITSVITLLFAGLLFFLGFMLPNMANYFCYPIAGLIIIGLILFDIVKVKTIREGRIETITFTKGGIRFENKISSLRESINWSSIVDIVVTKVDEEDEEDERENPNKIVVITPHAEEFFFLSHYETIFTNRKAIWERIQEIQSTFLPNT
ncbi:MAG: hypothetical protein ACTSO7_11130 [Candidatus Heimdallarchaeota archaeon]